VPLKGQFGRLAGLDRGILWQVVGLRADIR